jgi:hypothetical protein
MICSQRKRLMNERILFRASLIMILTLVGFALTSCQKSGNVQTGERTPGSQPAGAPLPPPPDGVRRITIAELKDGLDKGEVLFVDVRGAVEYKMGHIKGARSLPLGLIPQQFGDLPRDKLIVTYCA